MSASLVGSEMCIRDSSGLLCLRDAPLRRGPPELGPRFAVRLARRPRRMDRQARDGCSWACE
eukprot:4540889-Alexandrium_andersonii.AAC.1